MYKKLLIIVVFLALLAPFNALNAQLSLKDSIIYTQARPTPLQGDYI
jgi:hypothetical protein